MSLFSSEKFQKEEHLDLANATVHYIPRFLTTETADDYFYKLYKKTKWQQDDIKVYGKTYKQPRLTALYGEVGKSYSYSNITMHTAPFTPTLLEIKRKVEKTCHANFNIVLLNLYRYGSDSNGWHSDDEKELGPNPTIASVSLGEERKFQLRKKTDKKIRHNILLSHGSLLVMKGETQHFWQHQIPKTRKKVRPRINLTFRKII